MQLNLLYFARLRDEFGMATETLDFSGQTVSDLVQELGCRGDVWQTALGGSRPFRVAVNQTLARPETVLADGDEVALFPPVTGR